MSRPVALALSPHLDDAAFSCGGTLARLARAGWRVVVATLFTRSVPDPQGFALACQLDKGLGPEVDYMALRRKEDAAAMRAIGGEAEWLPFAEAPHRGYGSAAALFGPTRPDDGIVPDLADAMGALARRFRPDLILAPQAIGGHVDHVQAVRAIDAARPAAPIAWWRDFPYAARERRRPGWGTRPGDPTPVGFADSALPCRGGIRSSHSRKDLDHDEGKSFRADLLEPFATRFAVLPEHEVLLAPAESAAKRAACLAYASQLGFQFGGPAGLDAKLGGTGGLERFRGAPLP